MNESKHGSHELVPVNLPALFTNMRTLEFKTRLHIALFAAVNLITITSNEPWNTETHKTDRNFHIYFTDRNPPITNHKPWPFEPVKVKFCFLRGPLRWLTAAKTAIVSWLLNFRIRMFVKSAVSPTEYAQTANVKPQTANLDLKVSKKHRVCGNRQTWIFTTWPSFPLNCRSLFIITTQKSGNSCQFYP